MQCGQCENGELSKPVLISANSSINVNLKIILRT